MNQFKTFASLAVLSFLLIGISYWVISGNWGIILGLSMALPINFIIWFYSDKIALRAFGAESPNAEQASQLQPMLEKFSKSAQLQIPQIRHSRIHPVFVRITIVFAPLSASVIKLAISRTREFAADAGAARLTGNPRALASALQRLSANSGKVTFYGNQAYAPLFIVNSFSGVLLKDLFSTGTAHSAPNF